MKILFVQRTTALSEAFADRLQSEGHNIIAFAETLLSAHKAILTTDPEVAIIDGTFDPEETKRFSDTLSIMNTPHFIKSSASNGGLKYRPNSGPALIINCPEMHKDNDIVSHMLWHLETELLIERIASFKALGMKVAA